MKCPVCNTELPPTARFCGSCGTTLASTPPPPAPPPEQARAIMNAPTSWPPPAPGGVPIVQKKYKLLRLIAVLLKVFAFLGGALLVVVGLVVLVAGAASGSRSTTFNAVGPSLFTGVGGGLLMMLYGVLVFIFLYAYAQWMYVFMDIEENTRITNEMLSGRR